MHRGIDLAREHHAAQAFFRRHLLDGHARRRLEAHRAAMAVRRHALHPPLHVARFHAELMLEGAARPERRGLLVLGHTDALAVEIGRLLDLRRAPHQDLGVEQLARGEHRDPHEALIPCGERHHQRRHRHLGEVEVAELELAPEQFRWKYLAGQQVDAIGLDAAVEDRPGARVLRHSDAELQVHRRKSSATGNSASNVAIGVAPPRWLAPVSTSWNSPSGSATRASPQNSPMGARASGPSRRANRRGAMAMTRPPSEKAIAFSSNPPSACRAWYSPPWNSSGCALRTASPWRMTCSLARPSPRFASNSAAFACRSICLR